MDSLVAYAMLTRPLVVLIEMLTVLTPSVNVVKISQILMEHAQQVKCSHFTIQS